MKFAAYNLRMLSRGAVLKRFFYLREEIENFMKEKGKPDLEFQSSEWMQNLAFMVDITQHLNNLNKMLQGHKRLVTQYYDTTPYVHSSWSCPCGRHNFPVTTLLISFV